MLVDVRGVKVHFPIKSGVIFDRTVGYVYAVDGVDLQISRGETYGLVGESGCGKSTLGKAILNLEPPTEGSVLFDGIDIAELQGEELRRKRQDLQMVFQDPMSSLDPRQSVESLLFEGMKAHGLTADKAATHTRLRELLGAVDCPAGVVEVPPRVLRRAATADRDRPRPLRRPQADRGRRAGQCAGRVGAGAGAEPAGGPAGRVRADLPRIAHDLAVVRHISDRIGVMYLGGMVEESEAGELYDKPLHPYTRALMSAVPVPDPVVEDQREQILLAGDLPSPSNPPRGCRFHTRCPWRQPTRCDTERPELRVVEHRGRLARITGWRATGPSGSPRASSRRTRSTARWWSSTTRGARPPTPSSRSPRLDHGY